MWGEVGAAQPPARWGAPPGEYTEWKYRALVWWLMHGRATCACCQQCCWCKHRAAALPGGVPGLPKALLWGFVFVGSLESPKQLWVTRSACSPSPCGLEQLKQGYGAGHRGDAAAVPGLQSGPGLALLSELAVLISVCH